jgi:hypothetical protein
MEVSFSKFCTRPWFYRMWSVQELSLCGDVIIFYGDERFSSKGTDQVNVIQKITMPY